MPCCIYLFYIWRCLFKVASFTSLCLPLSDDKCCINIKQFPMLSCIKSHHRSSRCRVGCFVPLSVEWFLRYFFGQTASDSLCFKCLIGPNTKSYNGEGCPNFWGSQRICMRLCPSLCRSVFRSDRARVLVYLAFLSLFFLCHHFLLCCVCHQPYNGSNYWYCYHHCCWFFGLQCHNFHWLYYWFKTKWVF